MDEFLRFLKDKSIHIVGVTGAEGSNILRFLIKHGIDKITVHDFLKENSIEKSFKLWHKGITPLEKNNLFRQFSEDLKRVVCNFDQDYLINITSADIIFVPQSWRLYKMQNLPLWDAKQKKIPFYSLTRLYLDFSKAKIVAVTGTVGKGSVANILVQLLRKGEKKVYFAGNETWMLQVADKLDEMTQEDILALEISHRQLLDGFSRAPHIAVFTNLYPNHLDEVNWEEYRKLKLSLILAQNAADISVLNYDSCQLREAAKNLKSKVVFFSAITKDMNTKSIQSIYNFILNTKNDHYTENILAASTVANILDVPCEQIRQNIKTIVPLPARLEYLGQQSGIKFYDDIKSTTPWATLAGLKKLGKSTILICGGRDKGIDYHDFALHVKTLAKYIVFLESRMSQLVIPYLSKDLYDTVDDLSYGLALAYQKGKTGDNILLSPAASFFYSDFIKGKKSFKKLFTSLPLKGQPVEVPQK